MPESSLERRRTGRKLTAGALVEIGASLGDIDWRLLHWLLHYPLQRADDLVVGVARWASRATAYRYVKVLETRGLLESVLPKTPGTGKKALPPEQSRPASAGEASGYTCPRTRTQVAGR